MADREDWQGAARVLASKARRVSGPPSCNARRAPGIPERVNNINRQATVSRWLWPCRWLWSVFASARNIKGGRVQCGYPVHIA